MSDPERGEAATRCKKTDAEVTDSDKVPSPCEEHNKQAGEHKECNHSQPNDAKRDWVDDPSSPNLMYSAEDAAEKFKQFIKDSAQLIGCQPLFKTDVRVDELFLNLLKQLDAEYPSHGLLKRWGRCGPCLRFLRQAGSLVLISEKNGEITSPIWSRSYTLLTDSNDPFDQPYAQLIAHINTSFVNSRDVNITGLFVTPHANVGVENAELYSHLHFVLCQGNTSWIEHPHRPHFYNTRGAQVREYYRQIVNLISLFNDGNGRMKHKLVEFIKILVQEGGGGDDAVETIAASSASASESESSSSIDPSNTDTNHHNTTEGALFLRPIKYGRWVLNLLQEFNTISRYADGNSESSHALSNTNRMSITNHHGNNYVWRQAALCPLGYPNWGSSLLYAALKRVYVAEGNDAEDNAPPFVNTAPALAFLRMYIRPGRYQRESRDVTEDRLVEAARAFNGIPGDVESSIQQRAITLEDVQCFTWRPSTGVNVEISSDASISLKDEEEKGKDNKEAQTTSHSPSASLSAAAMFGDSELEDITNSSFLYPIQITANDFVQDILPKADEMWLSIEYPFGLSLNLSIFACAAGDSNDSNSTSVPLLNWDCNPSPSKDSGECPTTTPTEVKSSIHRNTVCMAYYAYGRELFKEGYDAKRFHRVVGVTTHPYHWRRTMNMNIKNQIASQDDQGDKKENMCDISNMDDRVDNETKLNTSTPHRGNVGDVVSSHDTDKGILANTKILLIEGWKPKEGRVHGILFKSYIHDRFREYAGTIESVSRNTPINDIVMDPSKTSCKVSSSPHEKQLKGYALSREMESGTSLVVRFKNTHLKDNIELSRVACIDQPARYAIYTIIE